MLRVSPSVSKCKWELKAKGRGEGVTPNFSWWGWSNRGKNQNPPKSPRLPTKLKKSLDQKLTPPPQKKKITNKKKPKALNDITRKIKTSSGRDRRALLTTNLQIVLNTQTNPYLNQATKKILAKFSYPPKNPANENFKPSKIFRSSPSLEIRSTPPGAKSSYKSHLSQPWPWNPL